VCARIHKKRFIAFGQQIIYNLGGGSLWVVVVFVVDKCIRQPSARGESGKFSLRRFLSRILTLIGKDVTGSFGCVWIRRTEHVFRRRLFASIWPEQSGIKQSSKKEPLGAFSDLLRNRVSSFNVRK